MTFAAPLALVALIALPILWWLMRVIPPAPRSEIFPAITLLLELTPTEETPARSPLWLTLLRASAAALLICALAGPIMNQAKGFSGKGPILLVLDNGWTAATDWSRRMQIAENVVDRAQRDDRKIALVLTAASASNTAPQVAEAMSAMDLRPILGAARPRAWPSTRATSVPHDWRFPGTDVIYIADGMADQSDFAAFESRLTGIGPVTEVCCPTLAPRLLLPPTVEAQGMTVRVARPSSAIVALETVLVRSGDGRALAKADITFLAGAAVGSATLSLPMEIRNRISQLALDGSPSAGSVYLLDDRWRRRPIGLVTSDMTSADAPLTGQLFYVRRALTPFSELREGDITTLLTGGLSVLILADRMPSAGADLIALTAWIEKGGLLIRFAGPRLAEGASPDPLLPVPLLNGDRQLGGAMSWSEPAGLAPFPNGSPFAGLAISPEVRITRQVLAEPGADLGAHTWAVLADGTPLVTRRAMGAGETVLFHVTANAEWSNLPLSGLFPDMLNRLTALSAAIANADDSVVLAPVEVLDGFGRLGRPPEAAQGLKAGAFGTTSVSPRHPPGLYGAENRRRALNMSSTAPALETVPMVGGAVLQAPGEPARETRLGPTLFAAAAVLLVIDLFLALGLRGLLRQGIAVLVILAVSMLTSRAEDVIGNPALATRLGYVVSGDARIDAVAQAGLLGLTAYVNRRTAIALVKPDAVEPGRSDLSLYPLLYWPIVADMPSLSGAEVAALNEFMVHGGIILIDTRGSGSGAGFAPGAEETLKRVARDLAIPPLAAVTSEHVLARSFYLLNDFPGRFTGDTVWAQRDQDRANDSVSPVIIGGNDWAGAWAADENGRSPFAVIPGGQRQRTMAYRFGINLVMYSLTGNYKGDQVHISAILQRLGQ